MLLLVELPGIVDLQRHRRLKWLQHVIARHALNLRQTGRGGKRVKWVKWNEQGSYMSCMGYMGYMRGKERKVSSKDQGPRSKTECRGVSADCGLGGMAANYFS